MELLVWWGQSWSIPDLPPGLMDFFTSPVITSSMHYTACSLWRLLHICPSLAHSSSSVLSDLVQGSKVRLQSPPRLTMFVSDKLDLMTAVMLM